MSTIPEKAVWALLEQQEGRLADGSLELIGETARLAQKLKTETVALVPGTMPADHVNLLAAHGAKRVVFVDHPALAEPSVELHAGLLASVIKIHSPEIVLAIHSVTGSDLAVRIATELGVGLVTACDRVDTNPERILVDTKPVYAGKAAAMCATTGIKPQMATLNLDALDLKTPNPKNTAEVITLTPEFQSRPARVRKVGFIKGDPKSISLTEAEIVVCAGMGIGTKQNLRMVEDLANAIGGSVAATRRVVDEGWVGLPRQVGLTGKTVRPKLYIACGVSGAIQHTLGMKDSRSIIAINTDKNAPIFKIADVAILADVLKVLPALTAHLKQALAQVQKPTVGDVLNAAVSLKAK
jgi:electron transfer flavoprotein alpha subunit